MSTTVDIRRLKVNMHFNVILPSTLTSSKWTLSVRMFLPHLFLPYLLPCRQPWIWSILRINRWDRVSGEMNVSVPLIPPGQGYRGETPATNRRRHDTAPRLVQVWHTYSWYKSSIHSFLLCVLTAAYRRMQAPLAGSLRGTLSYGDIQACNACRAKRARSTSCPAGNWTVISGDKGTAAWSLPLAFVYYRG